MKNLSRAAALLAYVISAAWYVWDAWAVFDAVESDERYPFFLDLDAWPSAAFAIMGSLYWVSFGLDRSGSPKAVLGYLMAGAHALVFALQVWIGPTLWISRRLAE